MPAERSIVPLKVLAAESTNVPKPVLVNPPAPLITPPTVNVFASTATLWVAGLLAAPVPRFKLLADPA